MRPRQGRGREDSRFCGRKLCGSNINTFVILFFYISTFVTFPRARGAVPKPVGSGILECGVRPLMHARKRCP